MPHWFLSLGFTFQKWTRLSKHIPFERASCSQIGLCKTRERQKPLPPLEGKFICLKLRYFYRTRVRSLGMLVTNSLTDWLTDSLLFSKLDWCDPGMWRWQLKTCWDCYCCSCWQSETCWQHFGADLEGDLVIKLSFCSYFEHKVSKFGQYFEVDVQARFWSWSLVIVLLLMLHVIMKFKIGLVKSFVRTCDMT